MTFLVLVLLLLVVAVGSNSRVWQYPFFSSSAWYRGEAESKISLLAEILDNLLLIDSGIFLIMEGGWFDPLWT